MNTVTALLEWLAALLEYLDLVCNLKKKTDGGASATEVATPNICLLTDSDIIMQSSF